MRTRAGIAAAALGLACAGCGISPISTSTEVTQYDFGPAPARKPAPLRQALLIYDVSAPGWLDSPSIYYRLAYQDAARPLAYADSRWVGPPAELIGSRVRGRLAASGKGGIVHPADGARASYALRVELDEFAQVFDAPKQSRAVVRLRASVLGRSALLAQKSFSVERPASTADAEGGVRALIEASDAAVDQLVDWTIASLKDQG
ncbi:MAG TPA: ABC-type transport auxiliary lipoprotein family protein [Burkholderiales bacterium]|nr:ABC-type transport auxiliary lipoprotein family protein [Burkholderiales bacterium]